MRDQGGHRGGIDLRASAGDDGASARPTDDAPARSAALATAGLATAAAGLAASVSTARAHRARHVLVFDVEVDIALVRWRRREADHADLGRALERRRVDEVHVAERAARKEVLARALELHQHALVQFARGRPGRATGRAWNERAGLVGHAGRSGELADLGGRERP